MFTNLPGGGRGGNETTVCHRSSISAVQCRCSCYCLVLSGLPEAKFELLSQTQLICHCEANGRAGSCVGNRAGWRRPEEFKMFGEKNEGNKYESPLCGVRSMSPEDGIPMMSAVSVKGSGPRHQESPVRGEGCSRMTCVLCSPDSQKKRQQTL